MDQELKESLNRATIDNCVLKTESERCETCHSLKEFNFLFTLSADGDSNDFTICLACASQIWPECASEFKREIVNHNSKKKYKHIRKSISTDITEEVYATLPDLHRNVELFLDGFLELSDGNQDEVLSDIYSKTIEKNRVPTEKQAALFNKIAGDILAAKNQGKDYKSKYRGREVDDLLSGIGVATLDPKFDDAFESIKKSFRDKGWISHKQFNFLNVMRNSQR